MTTIKIFQEFLTYFAITGGAACTAFILLFSLRHELDAVCRRWLRAGQIGRILRLLTLVAAVAYGGTKPPSSTNEPPDSTSGDASTTNAPPGSSGDGSSPTNLPPPTMFGLLPPTTGNTPPDLPVLSTVSAWTARGAWCDWMRVEFPADFTFPFGLDRLTGVTLMSQGCLRTSLTNFVAVAAFSAPLSIEPGATTVSYGPTTSNSYVFAWENALIDRSSTNRMDASFELFPDGTIITRFGTNVTSTAYQPPSDFIGEGQDENWLRANFDNLTVGEPPTNTVDEILAMGYGNWLDDYIGINQANARYQVAITVNSLPEGPCYMECGQYKLRLTQPGTYSFPMAFFDEYHLKTYPSGITYSLHFDDGYRGTGSSFTVQRSTHSMATQSTPAQTQSNAAPRPRLTAAPQQGDNGEYWMTLPIVCIEPSSIPYTEANGYTVTLWCKIPPEESWYETTYNNVRVMFNMMGDAELSNVLGEDLVRFCYRNGIHEISATLHLTDDDDDDDDPEPPGRTDADFYVVEGEDETYTNGFSVIQLTAKTASDSEAEQSESSSTTLPSGTSCYVAVYMVTSEDALNPVNCYDDIVTWNISGNGQTCSGSTSVYAQRNALSSAYSGTDTLGDVEGFPIRVAGQVFTANEGETLSLSINATAQNVGDGWRSTCVRVVVYPINNGELVGAPDWLQL